MLDPLTRLPAGTHQTILITGAALALIVLLLLGLKLRKILKSGKPAEKLVGPVMFVGMLWSAEVVWELAAAVGFPVGLRIAICAVLEFGLGIAMLRTKQHMADRGTPGRSGDTAWGIAWAMALVGFAAGIFFDHNLAVAILRPTIPLMLTKLWWDGILGESTHQRKRGSLRWTPRNLLLWIGAIEADERDVETVNRDRLIRQLVDLHRRWSNAANGKHKDRLEAKLIKLSEKADDSVIAEVREKRGRSTWFMSVPLAQHPSAHDLAQLAQELAHRSARSPAHDSAHTRAPRRASLKVPSAHRAKASAHGPTSKELLAQAAQAVIDGTFDSTRAAARKTGVPETSLRDLVKKLRSETPDRAPGSAHPAQASAHPQINGHPVTAGPTN